MSSQGSRREHNRFCQIEKWVELRNARNKKVRHHITYELELPDGRVLRTRVSRPADKTTYGADLWNHILAVQLCVTEHEFWECVKKRRPPNRALGATKIPDGALPAQLVHQLLHVVGVPEADIAGMTVERARELMDEYWSRFQA